MRHENDGIKSLRFKDASEPQALYVSVTDVTVLS